MKLAPFITAIALIGTAAAWPAAAPLSPRAGRDARLPVDPLPATVGHLDSIDCWSGSGCIAVGYRRLGGKDKPWAVRWDGLSWSAAPVPGHRQGRLYSVSCLHANLCLAAGFAGDIANSRPFALWWKRTGWFPAREPRGLESDEEYFSDSCRPRRGCAAVGDQIVTWQGGRPAGHLLRSYPATPGLRFTSVSCPSRGRCVVVGSDGQGCEGGSRAILGTRDGASIRVFAPAWKACGAWLYTSCAGSTCHVTGTGLCGLVLVSETRGVWARERCGYGPSSHKESGANAAGISCWGARSCMAVGQTQCCGTSRFRLFKPWTSRPLALLLRGRQWREIAVRKPINGILQGVSCVGARFCLAVGWVEASYQRVGRPLAMRWNGRKWRVVT